MPPKRAAARRKGATPTRPEEQTPESYFRDMNPAAKPTLPDLPTKHSFAYGSTSTPLLPRELRARPRMGLAEIADAIDEGIQMAQEREDDQHNTRSARKRTASPVRRREPTPDQVQLMGSLQDAMDSPTPTPPVPHTFSEVSTPASQAANNLHYPTPMMQLGPTAPNDADLESSLQVHFADNDSTISWDVEREVHDDDLQRVGPTKKGPQGRRAALHALVVPVPPPSLSKSKSRTPEPAVVESVKRKSASPARPSSTNPRGVAWLFGYLVRIMWFVVVGVGSISAAVSYGDVIVDVARDLFPLGRTSPSASPSGTKLAALNSLNEVFKLGTQVSSLSREVKTIKTEVKNIPAATTVVESGGRTGRARTNFLSLGMGVIIDPHRTSPSSRIKQSYYEKMFPGSMARKPQPALTALTPWQDVGECWCSKPRRGMSQLSVLLQQRIVPEEVVVEHIPKGATIRPEVAPRDMELWVRFAIVDGAANTPWHQGLAHLSRQSTPLVREGFSLHDTVIETLKLAYPGQPESAYYGDPLLGLSFYRVGQWTYDINRPQHVQTFDLDAVLDMPSLRVDHVVIRAKNNWGADDTCLYRVKLHGHL
ncbi:hypothetical protein P168DRAFT_304869 [Aspergillus campestris IBT 28561]|uniref:SUN domain-containing protein n=1 Tax=Aspergillus campestris (strain IBT 28561) TaxID=1392248 RepID=A0A2I1D0V6_ASPC2|nr:uncharacterized protein P168DRAFT_304869 [Aspergillus campestris IBT 28561]PKY03503.1 hypothetical protein P168DRAFT_304869 [Aspergillus campestris IBT 28561]